MFSKACEYGIRAAVYVALQSLDGRRVSVNEIAEEIDSPIAFTAKILQQLSRSKVIHSVKGPTGGFELDRTEMDTVKLSMIVHAIDGDDIYVGCGLGLKECNANQPCPLHDKFVDIRTDLKNMLENTSLYELATGLEVGLTYLKR
ncbi:MAG: Rrf2 family transcriptional regulator [Bacteroidota bacterium]|nr:MULTISPECIES: Rrf2 family transcriptional regulator [Allomuricauda]MEC7264058.1 Rrf2 family transcriptional regulator [Bacteroidota bacterium]RUA13745.1 MAG: Rrf2 family transcriptional regulator [Flavobacteriia bacterium]MBW8201285.1 Rrf2 family transcriptional regulator [Allomuricauda abyssi]RIV71614.1 Rrf2 family transcriptional regulator [Allomuricauda aequoris]TXK03242.1 Rrf2 family transcriptional regulator [Allomuricauda aequoris]